MSELHCLRNGVLVCNVLFVNRLRLLAPSCRNLRFAKPMVSRSGARKDPSDASNGQMTVATGNQTQSDTLDACRRGDQDALRLVFETHRDRVYSLALRFTGDATAAWDLTQEVFIKVFSRLGEFRNQAKFETWLYRIVLNACIDEQRRNKRFVPLEKYGKNNERSEAQPQEKSYIRRQVTEAVQAAVARLSPKVKAPILLRYVEGLSYEEIAEVLGCRAGTVAARLNRGHKILARELAGLRGVML